MDALSQVEMAGGDVWSKQQERPGYWSQGTSLFFLGSLWKNEKWEDFCLTEELLFGGYALVVVFVS